MPFTPSRCPNTNFATSLVSLISLLVLLGMTGCDEAETEPAYLQLSGVELVTTAGEGAATEDINSVWVFLGTEFLGAFATDALIPILETGERELRFAFGVRENGMIATPNIYDFYASVNRQLSLVPGETLTLDPLPVRYDDNVQFALVDGFEIDEERAFDFVLTGEVALERTNELARSGQASGVIELDRAGTFDVEIATSQVFGDLVGQVGQVWLEVDYLSDTPVLFGLVQDVPPGEDPPRVYDPGFIGRPDWTKVYFNLTGPIVRTGLTEYRFGLRAVISDPDQESATVFLDNIKVLYF